MESFLDEEKREVKGLERQGFLHLHLSHLADALISETITVEITGRCFAYGAQTEFSQSQLRDLRQQPFSYWHNAVNH